jgi:ATP-dependent exoDNAse (exonuclease V) beta subunit
MKNLGELEEYIEKTEDAQLAMMVEIVKEYGNEIPEIVRTIKEKHIDGDNKEDAEMIFSTVHRSKGMEYDAVQIVNDFITEEKLVKINTSLNQEEIDFSKLNEEINLLYVAITRARNSIYIPEPLMPIDFPRSKHIHVMRVLSEEEKQDKKIKTLPAKSKPNKYSEVVGEAYSVEEIRIKHHDAYSPWTQELDDELTVMFCEGVNVKDLARHFGRSKGAIRSRIMKLELEELYG